MNHLLEDDWNSFLINNKDRFANTSEETLSFMKSAFYTGSLQMMTTISSAIVNQPNNMEPFMLSLVEQCKDFFQSEYKQAMKNLWASIITDN